MKTYNEMADSVLERIRENEKERKAKIARFKKTSCFALLTLSVIGVIGVGAWKLTGNPETSADRIETTENVISKTETNVHGNEGNLSENVFEKGYTYSVDSGKYASYVKGKVIVEKYVKSKLEDVTVTAGWVDSDGKKLSEEHAKAEIYAIDGISADVAVAIKFTEKLEAQLTTCYYVIMNPDADLSPVIEYVIKNDPVSVNDGDMIPE